MYVLFPLVHAIFLMHYIFLWHELLCPSCIAVLLVMKKKKKQKQELCVCVFWDTWFILDFVLHYAYSSIKQELLCDFFHVFLSNAGVCPLHQSHVKKYHNCVIMMLQFRINFTSILNARLLPEDTLNGPCVYIVSIPSYSSTELRKACRKVWFTPSHTSCQNKPLSIIKTAVSYWTTNPFYFVFSSISWHRT